MDKLHTIVFLKGLEEHSANAFIIHRLRQTTGQDGNFSTDPDCFAKGAVDWGNRPWTILLLENGEPVGAVLLRETLKRGIPTGYFFAEDASGEEFVLAPSDKSGSILRACIEALTRLKRSAVVLLRTKTDYSQAAWNELKYGSGLGVVRYALPLQQTVEETLREVGTHTKKHLRYYAASALRAGVTFHPDMSAQERQEAVASLYPKSDYRPSKQRMAANMAAMDRHLDSFTMGLRSAKGEWISLAMGWRDAGTTNIFFLMHHVGYRKASLSTTMRSLMVAHEVERHSERLVVVGGPNAVVQRSCVEDVRYELLLGRPSWRRTLLVRLGLYLPAKHPLREFLEQMDVDGISAQQIRHEIG